MNKKINIARIAQTCIATEAKAIEHLHHYINSDFEKAVNVIFSGSGRLIITGIGKSAVVAQKIVATLNSTGTPSIFLHAADAIHGDLGMVQSGDVIMVISKSGDSAEIKVLIPLLKNFGNTIIGMVGKLSSYLAKHCDILINTTVSEEACPNNLAPTSSTTAQMVMGDAIAVCLMELRGFSTKDFAKFHPGGALGKKLYLRVDDLYKQNEKPSIKKGSGIKEIIVSISQSRLGASVVIDAHNQVEGVVTDGDLRRMLEKDISLETIKAKDIMTINPVTIDNTALAIEALDLMRQKNITQLIVTKGKIYLGIVHLHDIVREGIV